MNIIIPFNPYWRIYEACFCSCAITINKYDTWFFILAFYFTN